jgi:hypothetical protein
MLLLCAPIFSQTSSLIAEKILSIGSGVAGGPYVFVQIADVKTDSAGNIYVLDSLRARIAKFDPAGALLSTIGKPLFDVENQKQEREYKKNSELLEAKIIAARTTGELYSPKSLYIDEKNILVTDTGKLVLFDLLGNVERVVTPKGMPLYYAAFPNARGELTVLGLADEDFLFHVLDREGRIIRSFGERFNVPSKISDAWSGDTKNSKIKMASMPISYYIGSADESLIMNPFQYEIGIFREERLWRTLTGPSPYSSGFAGISESHIGDKLAGLISGAIAPPVILKKDDLILVFQVKDRGATPASALRSFQLDVFKNSEYYKSFDLMFEGYPKCLGPNGHLFTIGSGSVLFVNEYVLKSLPGL